MGAVNFQRHRPLQARAGTTGLTLALRAALGGQGPAAPPWCGSCGRSSVKMGRGQAKGGRIASIVWLLFNAAFTWTAVAAPLDGFDRPGCMRAGAAASKAQSPAVLPLRLWPPCASRASVLPLPAVAPLHIPRFSAAPPAVAPCTSRASGPSGCGPLHMPRLWPPVPCHPQRATTSAVMRAVRLRLNTWPAGAWPSPAAGAAWSGAGACQTRTHPPGAACPGPSPGWPRQLPGGRWPQWGKDGGGGAGEAEGFARHEGCQTTNTAMALLEPAHAAAGQGLRTSAGGGCRPVSKQPHLLLPHPACPPPPRPLPS